MKSATVKGLFIAPTNNPARLDMQGVQPMFVDGQEIFSHVERMARRPQGGARPHKEVGDRLRLMMEARGLTSAQVAAVLGVSPTRFSNWVVGSFEIPKECVRELRRYGVTMEWVYFGDTAHISVDFANALAKAEARRQNAKQQQEPGSNRKAG